MEPQTIYYIQNVGCDDETTSLLHLEEDELKFLLAVFYNLNRNSSCRCMPRIYIAKAREDMFIPLLTSEQIEAVDSRYVFYDQFGSAFTWAKGYGYANLSWIDYELYKSL